MLCLFFLIPTGAFALDNSSSGLLITGVHFKIEAQFGSITTTKNSFGDKENLYKQSCA